MRRSRGPTDPSWFEGFCGGARDRIDVGRRAFVDALIGIPFAGVALSAQFFRDLEKRGEYFGNGSPEATELAHRLYGIVNVGPPLKL